MASNNRDGKLSKKKVVKKAIKKSSFPKIYQDKENNYLSIKLRPGIEVHSYLKKGILFLEDEKGEVVEIQVVEK